MKIYERYEKLRRRIHKFLLLMSIYIYGVNVHDSFSPTRINLLSLYVWFSRNNNHNLLSLSFVKKKQYIAFKYFIMIRARSEICVLLVDSWCHVLIRLPGVQIVEKGWEGWRDLLCKFENQKTCHDFTKKWP